MSKTVQPGQTLFAHGTLAAGGTLVVDPGYATEPGGLVVVRGAATNEGRVSLFAGDTQGDPGATATITSHGVLTNAGTIALYGAAAGAGSAALSVAGTLANTNQIFVCAGYPGAPGLLEITAPGTLTNAGTLDVGVLSGYGVRAQNAVGGTLTNAGVLSNTGTLIVYGGTTRYYHGSQGSVLDVTGTLANAGLLVLNGGRDQSLYHAPAGQSTGATLNVEAAGTLTNTGTVLVYGGADIFNPGGNDATGALLRVQGALTNAHYLIVAGSFGDYGAPPPAGTLSVSGVLTNTDLLQVNGGGTRYNSGSGGLGGVLSVTGTLINTDYVIASGGYGTTGISTGGTIELAGTLINSSQLYLGDSYTLNAAAATGGTLIDSGLLTNTGTIDIAGVPSRAAAAGALTLTAAGTLQGTGTIFGGGSLVNDGLIAAAAGTLSISTAIAATPGAHGRFSLATGADLTLKAAIAADQSVIFAGSSTLALSAPLSFAGTLDSLAPGDVIDFLQLTITAAHTTGATLILTQSGGATFDLALNAPLPAADTLSLHPDGTGGTDLVLLAPNTADHAIFTLG